MFRPRSYRCSRRTHGPREVRGLRETTDLRGTTDPTGMTDLQDPTEATGLRETTEATDRPETIVPRTAGEAKTAIRETVTTEARAAIRAADRTADNSRAEEAAAMADLRETEETDFRDLAGRVWKAARVTGAVLAAVRAADAVLTVLRAITAAMEDREPDSGIRTRARALAERLRQRTWIRGARKTRGAQAARRRISAPGRIISTRRTRR